MTERNTCYFQYLQKSQFSGANSIGDSLLHPCFTLADGHCGSSMKASKGERGDRSESLDFLTNKARQKARGLGLSPGPGF